MNSSCFELSPGERKLADFAASKVPSRGRYYTETECPTRSPFQRDRDRVLHATAFRRLTHKTQVFFYHEGDHYRTRLTHSLEVAQIARTIARQLCLDEDLTETLALAHDLGHPPFGHAGERTLDFLMKEHGGFNHNVQSLRVVTKLERKYQNFNGLNLTWETLEGLAKHNGPLKGEKSSALIKVIKPLEAWQSFQPGSWASGEAQVAALSDDIAYLTHDTDDALRGSLLSLSDLKDIPFVGFFVRNIIGQDELKQIERASFELIRSMITALIRDVVNESRQRLLKSSPKTSNDIRQSKSPIVSFSECTWKQLESFRTFLFKNVYHHKRVLKVMTAADSILNDLFNRYSSHDGVTELPENWQKIYATLNERRRARLICDYLAGQTDRFAIQEHRRLFDQTPDLR
ncbi:MAG: deoxyguanosinetriphosphate triphosphohydrolase [Hyphomicrobium sp.]